MATFVQLPVIDISATLPKANVAKDLVEAAATYGFVYIKNLGKDIPVETIDNIFALSKKFFSSSVEEKQTCKIQDNNRGWVAMHAETLNPKIQRIGDFKEAMNIAEFENGKARQSLPPCFIAHEAEIDAFQKLCHDMMLKLLVLFAIGLEIDPVSGGSSWFSTRHTSPEPSHCTLRLLHYPPIPAGSDYQPAVDIRAGAHSDYGSITLLFQRPGQPGLEIIPPSPNSSNDTSSTAPWTPVPIYPPGTETDPSPPILINIGDLLSHWTNNLFKSTVHRVAFPADAVGEDRYSIAYFGHPVGKTMLEAVPCRQVEALRGNGGEVEAMTADEHLMSRLKATYLGMYKDEKGGEAVAA